MSARPYTREEIEDFRREWIAHPDPCCPPPGETDRWLATVDARDEALREAAEAVDELGARIQGVLRGVRAHADKVEPVGGIKAFERDVNAELERGRAALAKIESVLGEKETPK